MYIFLVLRNIWLSVLPEETRESMDKERELPPNNVDASRGRILTKTDYQGT